MNPYEPPSDESSPVDRSAAKPDDADSRLLGAFLFLLSLVSAAVILFGGLGSLLIDLWSWLRRI